MVIIDSWLEEKSWKKLREAKLSYITYVGIKFIKHKIPHFNHFWNVQFSGF